MLELLLFYLLIFYFCIRSPFLFVICDDRVIRYTGADDDTSDVVDAQMTE